MEVFVQKVEKEKSKEGSKMFQVHQSLTASELPMQYLWRLGVENVALPQLALAPDPGM